MYETHVENGVASVQRHAVLHFLLPLRTIRILCTVNIAPGANIDSSLVNPPSTYTPALALRVLGIGPHSTSTTQIRISTDSDYHRLPATARAGLGSACKDLQKGSWSSNTRIRCTHTFHPASSYLPEFAGIRPSPVGYRF